MRIMEIIADAGNLDTLAGIAGQNEVEDVWSSPPGENGRCISRMLVNDAARREVIDSLQSMLGASEGARIVIQPVEAVLPRSSEERDTGKSGTGSGAGPGIGRGPAAGSQRGMHQPGCETDVPVPGRAAPHLAG